LLRIVRNEARPQLCGKLAAKAEEVPARRQMPHTTSGKFGLPALSERRST
jgi:hypothetical protein